MEKKRPYFSMTGISTFIKVHIYLLYYIQTHNNVENTNKSFFLFYATLMSCTTTTIIFLESKIAIKYFVILSKFLQMRHLF